MIPVPKIFSGGIITYFQIISAPAPKAAPPCWLLETQKWQRYLEDLPVSESIFQNPEEIVERPPTSRDIVPSP